MRIGDTIIFEPSRSFANIPHGAICNIRQITAISWNYYFETFVFNFVSQHLSFQDRNRRMEIKSNRQRIKNALSFPRSFFIDNC